MSTSPLPTPTLRPLATPTEGQGLLPIVETGATCCGDSCCIGD